MVKKVNFSTSLVLFLFLTSVVFAGTPADSLFGELDRTLEKKEEYLKKKQDRIVAIKKQFPNSEYNDKAALQSRYAVSAQLFEEYKSFIYDSAFSYGRELLQTAYKLKETPVINDAKVKISFTLLSAGMFKEALDTLNSIHVEVLTKDAKVEYYAILARTYYDLADYSNDSFFSERYNKIGNGYLQRALDLCDPNSVRFLLLRGLGYMRARDIANGILVFEKVLGDPKLTKPEMAVASSSLSYLYRLNHNPEKAKFYLAKAAVADIIYSIRETVAIRELAEILYEGKDIDRSYKYVKVALEDAYFYGSKHRKIQIANLLPIIEGTQLSIVEGQKRDLFYYSITATILIVLIVLFAVIIYRQNRRLDAAKLDLTLSHENLEKTNAQLAESNQELVSANELLKFQGEEIKRMNQLLVKENEVLQTDVVEMAKARVMLRDVNFSEFSKIFPDSEACMVYLANLKWKDGFTCRKCGNTKHGTTDDSLIRRCTKCRYTESPMAYTIFQKCKFPLNKAFYILFLVYASKDKITSLELSEMLDLRLSTCWQFGRKVKMAMESKRRFVFEKEGYEKWESLIPTENE
jgi:hypothetical protein